MCLALATLFFNAAQALWLITVKTLQFSRKSSKRKRIQNLSTIIVNSKLFMHMVGSCVFNNKVMIYVWFHNMFYIWGFSFVFGNFNRLIFLISLTPINVTINILRVYKHNGTLFTNLMVGRMRSNILWDKGKVVWDYVFAAGNSQTRSFESIRSWLYL